MARVKNNGGMSLHLQLLKMWLCILKILVSNKWTLHIRIHISVCGSVYIQVLTLHQIQYPRKDEQLHGIKKTLPDHRYVWEHKVNPWARLVWTLWSIYTQIIFSINIVGPSYLHFASQIQPTIDQNSIFTFLFEVSQLQIPNGWLQIRFSICGWLEPWLWRANYS